MKCRILSTLLISLFLIAPELSMGQTQKTSTKKFIKELDRQIPEWLDEFIVPGAAIVIIDDGEVVLKKGYGYADKKKDEKVGIHTGFNIGSISKTVAAWGVMKLVEDGVLDLDTPAETYLTRWKLPKTEFDPKEVTLRRLLSHTAGLSLHGYPGWSSLSELPSIEESLNGKNNGPGDVRIILEPGTQWKYSGGGFTISQLIIEEVTGQDFSDYMQSTVLDPLGMTHSSYEIDEEILAASSQEHNAFGETIDFEYFTAEAAAGLHTTIEDFSKFALASLSPIKKLKDFQSVLDPSTVADMAVPAPASNGGYGLGYSVQTFDNANTTLVGHGGANTGWHAFLRVNQETGDGFAMVTNGGSGYNVYNQAYCAWLEWEYDISGGNRCKKSIAPVLINALSSEGIDKAIAKYHDIKQNQKDDYYYGEGLINGFGYQLLQRGSIKEAIAFFDLNVKEHPDSYNVYDSLGEAYMENGQNDLAIKNYKISIELNPDNINGKEMLKKLMAKK